jgi:uncharacterized membrane protein (UPF0127 family)
MERGLSGTNESPALIFQWPSFDWRVFWMKDTFTPLSAVPLGLAGQVLEIIPMEPNTSDFHWTASPVSTVLEVRTNLIDALHLQVGTRVDISNCR